MIGIMTPRKVETAYEEVDAHARGACIMKGFVSGLFLVLLRARSVPRGTQGALSWRRPSFSSSSFLSPLHSDPFLRGAFSFSLPASIDVYIIHYATDENDEEKRRKNRESVLFYRHPCLPSSFAMAAIAFCGLPAPSDIPF